MNNILQFRLAREAKIRRAERLLQQARATNRQVKYTSGPGFFIGNAPVNDPDGSNGPRAA